MRYCLGPPDAYAPIWAALAFMPFGLFFDFMDGKVARWRKKSSLMGQELDSLADLVRQERITSTTKQYCLLWSGPILENSQQRYTLSSALEQWGISIFATRLSGGWNFSSG